MTESERSATEGIPRHVSCALERSAIEGVHTCIVCFALFLCKTRVTAKFQLHINITCVSLWFWLLTNAGQVEAFCIKYMTLYKYLK